MHRKARPTGKFISLRDAEIEFGIPYHTFYRWVDRGLIPRLSEDVVGQAIRIRRDDLEAFIASNMTKGGSRV
jgi:excisionase family DNA binding protein